MLQQNKAFFLTKWLTGDAFQEIRLNLVFGMMLDIALKKAWIPSASTECTLNTLTLTRLEAPCE